jgi:hypothetical protein
MKALGLPGWPPHLPMGGAVACSRVPEPWGASGWPLCGRSWACQGRAAIPVAGPRLGEPRGQGGEPRPPRRQAPAGWPLATGREVAVSSAWAQGPTRDRSTAARRSFLKVGDGSADTS